MWSMANARQNQLSNPKSRSLKKQLANAQKKLKRARQWGDEPKIKRWNDNIANIKAQLSQ